MSDKSGTTKKETDWLGREKEVHYDSDGKKVGETKFTTDWLGRSKQEHYDTSGNKTGETKKGSDWLGRDRAEHYDKEGNKTGYSKNETDWLGRPVQRHYNTSWERVGETRRGEDWLGRPRKEHKGEYQKARSGRSSSSSATSSHSSSYNPSYGGYSSPRSSNIGAIIIFILLGGGLLVVIGVVRSFVNSWETNNSASSSIVIKSTVKEDKIGRGRTSDEKVHEFVLPANQWVETSLLIKPNQEVLVHHFASNEPVTVNLAGTTFPTLQKAGTLIPLYTSKNCSKDSGVKAKVKYFCVQLNQPESIKMFASNSVRVGVVVKNR